MLQTVLDALQELRSPFAFCEMDLHAMVRKCLTDHGIAFVHEARIGAGCRIDYLAGNVGIEIKKGKPDARALSAQLARYAGCDQISALVVLTQRSVSLPKRIGSIPVYGLVLNQLWGVALP